MFAAASLDGGLPEIDPDAPVQLRRLRRSRDADPRGRARGRLRRGEPEVPDGAVRRRGSSTSPWCSRRTGSSSSSRRPTRPASSGRRPRASPASSSSSRPRASRSATTRARCSRRLGPSDVLDNVGQRGARREGRGRQGDARRGRRRVRLRDGRDAGAATTSQVDRAPAERAARRRVRDRRRHGRDAPRGRRARSSTRCSATTGRPALRGGRLRPPVRRGSFRPSSSSRAALDARLPRCCRSSRIFLRVSPGDLVRPARQRGAVDALVVSLEDEPRSPTSIILARRHAGRLPPRDAAGSAAGRLVLTLIELPLVLPPAVAGIAPARGLRPPRPARRARSTRARHLDPVHADARSSWP